MEDDRTTEFQTFAVECGLTRFIDPTGERYVMDINGSVSGKKSEETDFMDELWNALVTAKNRPDLLV